MRKFALLIGISQYQFSLDPLPSAEEDVRAMERILQDPSLGDFGEDDVTLLINAKREDIEAAVYNLFADRQRDDLLVFYFSGHGFADEAGKLFLTTPSTQKDRDGYVIPHTAIDAGTIQERMSKSKSDHQVLILDCCFSGAFAKGMTVKSNLTFDVKSQLGGKGRAILTSSDSTKYSFHQQGFTLSMYTHYLVEGIETGSADQNQDGQIDVDELHEYVRDRIQRANIPMSPQFFPVKEGHKIFLAKAPNYARTVRKQILFLPSNFKQPDWRHLDRELYEIEEHLKLTKSERLVIRKSNSAFVEDFQKAASGKESEIIHFSGFVSGEGIALENEARCEISTNSESWISLFESIAKHVSCIVLSRCYIEEQAKEIGRHVDNVIGISSQLSELDSNRFLKYFYSKLSSGYSIETSFIESCDETSKFTEEVPTLIRHIRKKQVLEETILINREKLKAEPKNLRLLNALSSNLVELNRHSEAIEIYDRALKIVENGHSLMRQKASALEKTGRYIEALEVCEKALEIAPEDCSLLRQNSSILRNLERYEESLLLINKALNIEPQNYLAWIERGSVLEKLLRIEQAIQSYEKSLELSHHNSFVANKLVSLKHLFESQNQEEKDAQNTTKIQSNEYEDWVIEAYLSEDLGLYEDAVISYRRAIELNPNSIITLIQFGKLLQRLERFQEAIGLFDQVLAHQPDNYVVGTYRGIALRALLQNKQAVSSFRQSLKYNPNYRAAKYEQRWTYRNR